MTLSERKRHAYDEMPLLTPAMSDGVVDSIYVSADKRFRYRNPMVEAYGKSNMNATCESCTRLHKPGKRYKCFLRRTEKSDGGDHRVNWQACIKYEGGDI